MYICSCVKTGNGSADVCWRAEWRRDGGWEGRFRTANAAGHGLTANTKPKNPQALSTTALRVSPQFKCLDVTLQELAVQPIIRNYTFFSWCATYIKNNVVQDILRLNGIEWNAAGVPGCDRKWLTAQTTEALKKKNIHTHTQTPSCLLSLLLFEEHRYDLDLSPTLLHMEISVRKSVKDEADGAPPGPYSAGPSTIPSTHWAAEWRVRTKTNCEDVWIKAGS